MIYCVWYSILLYIDTFRDLTHRSSVRYLMRRLYMQWILCKSKTENNIISLSSPYRMFLPVASLYLYTISTARCVRLMQLFDHELFPPAIQIRALCSISERDYEIIIDEMLWKSFYCNLLFHWSYQVTYLYMATFVFLENSYFELINHL